MVGVWRHAEHVVVVGENMEDGCFGRYINVMFILFCVKVDVFYFYWFLNDVVVFGLGL